VDSTLAWVVVLAAHFAGSTAEGAAGVVLAGAGTRGQGPATHRMGSPQRAVAWL
jgi:hypothetical protein